MQSTTKVEIRNAELRAVPLLIGQAALYLRRQARRETAARYYVLTDLAARLQGIVANLENFLERAR